MKNAIYPLSADPIHNGHINNIKRLIQIFDHVYIAIGKNYIKKPRYLFTDKEKLLITKKALANIDRKKITVELFEGLLSHYAKKKNTNIIIRGARNSIDFENEQTAAEFNQAYNLSTFIIPAPKDTFTLSSTMIKAIVDNGGLVHEFVPPVIKQALEEKILQLNLIGVTGNTGAGKTSFCKELSAKNKNINYIEVDKVIKELYRRDEEVQKKVKNVFGANIYQGKKINRKRLGYLIFTNHEQRLKLVDILRTPFKMALENKIKNLHDTVLIDCAYLVEYDLLPVVNYNIVLLTCKNETKISRNKKAAKIIPAQYNDKKLKQEIKLQQKKVAHKNFLQINTDEKINYAQIAKRLNKWRILN